MVGYFLYVVISRSRKAAPQHLTVWMSGFRTRLPSGDLHRIGEVVDAEQHHQQTEAGGGGRQPDDRRAHIDPDVDPFGRPVVHVHVVDDLVGRVDVDPLGEPDVVTNGVQCGPGRVGEQRRHDADDAHDHDETAQGDRLLVEPVQRRTREQCDHRQHDDADADEPVE